MEQNESAAVETNVSVEEQINNTTEKVESQDNNGLISPFSGNDDVPEEAAPVETTDIQYEDFSIPEDWQVDSELISNFKEFGKSKGHTQEDMQAIIDMHVAANKKALDEYKSNISKMNREWYEEIKKDAEFGGENFKKSTSNINYLFEKFDTDGKLRKVLEESGASTHPDLYRFLARIGSAHANDGPNNKQGRNTPQEVPLTEFLWPKGTMPVFGE